MPIGCGQACRTSQQQSLGFSFRRHLFSRLDLFSSHLISSHRSFSLKVLIASHCHHSLCHRISSRFISCRVSFSIRRISSHPIISHHISSYLIISHLISSPLISGLLCLSQLFSADHNSLMSSELFSSLLSSSEFFSFQLSSASPFCYSALHRSSHVRPSQLIPSHLTVANFCKGAVQGAVQATVQSAVTRVHSAVAKSGKGAVQGAVQAAVHSARPLHCKGLCWARSSIVHCVFFLKLQRLKCCHAMGMKLVLARNQFVHALA